MSSRIWFDAGLRRSWFGSLCPEGKVTCAHVQRIDLDNTFGGTQFVNVLTFLFVWWLGNEKLLRLVGGVVTVRGVFGHVRLQFNGLVYVSLWINFAHTAFCLIVYLLLPFLFIVDISL